MKKNYIFIALLTAFTTVQAQTTIDFSTGYTDGTQLSAHTDWATQKENASIDGTNNRVNNNTNWNRIVYQPAVGASSSNGNLIWSRTYVRFGEDGESFNTTSDRNIFACGFKGDNSAANQNDRETALIQSLNDETDVRLGRQGSGGPSSTPSIDWGSKGLYEVYVAILLGADAASSKAYFRLTNMTNVSLQTPMVEQSTIAANLYTQLTNTTGIHFWVWPQNVVNSGAGDNFSSVYIEEVQFGVEATDATLKTEINDSGLKFAIAPNPASDNLRVLGNVDSVDIIDLVGNTVISGAGTSVDVSNLASGVYIVKASSADGVGTKKFVKN